VMFGQDLLEVTTFRGSSPESAVKDEMGRVLRDNTFGLQHEDAVRRDFTINAMYYNPATEEVYDYHGGISDIRHKTLRVIGKPEERFREDPIRMLRVVRFAAKLGFTIDPATRAPIPAMAPLINNVPASRVFDEMLKLLMSGYALACLNQLRNEGLHHDLLPMLDVALNEKQVELLHFDLYRMASPDEFLDAGFREYFNENAICIVEWPDKAGAALPLPDIHVFLHVDGLGRKVELQGLSDKGSQCLDRLNFAPNL